jgi:large exoprotein involved in heme utilization and adhesion
VVADGVNTCVGFDKVDVGGKVGDLGGEVDAGVVAWDGSDSASGDVRTGDEVFTVNVGAASAGNVDATFVGDEDVEVEGEWSLWCAGSCPFVMGTAGLSAISNTSGMVAGARKGGGLQQLQGKERGGPLHLVA